MKKFSELTDKEKYALGREMGDRLNGSASYPEAEMETFLEAREIEHDAEPTDNEQFCNGMDDVTICCEDCNGYTDAEDVNEWGICSNCACGDEEDED